MATNEPIAKRLTELQAKLTERAGTIKDPKNADRALMLEGLALLSEGLAKLGRDVRELKAAKGKPKAGAVKGKAGKPGAKKASAAKPEEAPVG